MSKIILITALICSIALSFQSLAANPSTKDANTSISTQKDVLMVLKQDSGINISDMNITFTISPTYGSAQAVKFKAPKAGWKLENIFIVDTDGWNASNGQLPKIMPFAIEIRDLNLKTLYHFEDVQLPYFTSDTGVRMANIEIPSLLINGDFFVCFYGYRFLGLGTELQNATGNSYYFDKLSGDLYSSGLPMKDNKTLPINWLIRVAGQ
jgi:hypothetical protein